MGHLYGQLSQNERLEIYHLQQSGWSLRRIAQRLMRSVSTVSREIARNSKPRRNWQGGYCPVRAQRLAKRRRQRDNSRYKLVRQPELLQYVTDHLAMGWSPQLISGRLARLQIGLSISHESIYRYIYYRRELKDYLFRLLPQARSRRRKHGAKQPFCARIPKRKSITERPAHVETRKEAGHWEADMMLFSKPAHGLVDLCERSSRYLTLRRVKGRKADTVSAALLKNFAAIPPDLRKSCTFDNGVEFWRHQSLAKAYDLATWFCDPYAPWQKGSVENAIGRLRRRLPRHTNLDQIKPKTLKEITNAYNNTPRVCLDFQTPNEVYSKQTVALRT